jgi:uncharacterized protein (DUF362 family)
VRRRKFLGLAAVAAVGRPSLAVGSGVAKAGTEATGLEAAGLEGVGLEGRGRVVSVSVPGRPAGAAGVAADRAAAQRGIDEGIAAGIAALTGLRAASAWASIFRPDDRIAIKLNCLAGPHLAPRPALVDAIVRGLTSAGVREEAIVIFDRTSRELEHAGYPVRTASGALRCFGTDALKGGGYGSEILEHRSIGSFFTRILMDHATALINVGVCKDHDLAGVSAGGKNLYGLIHNPNRYHSNSCSPYVADLLDHPAVRSKLRLTVIDAGTIQCHGGPAYNPAHLVAVDRILLARDSVAVDRIAWEMIEAERARQGLPTLAEEKREPVWIAAAAQLGLGTADRDRIDLVEAAG